MTVPGEGEKRFSRNATPFAHPSDFSRERHREAIHAKARRFLGKYMKPGSTGAELGVFWAHFADIIADEFAPKKLYLVDPYDRLHGANYPDWGRYTNFGKLTTAETEAKAREIEARHPGKVELRKETAVEFLAGMPDGHFDWLYLDAGHTKAEVKRDLMAAWPKMKPGGYLIGDDYFLFDADLHHTGVIHAVNEFVEEHDLELMFEDHNQYMIRRPKTGGKQGEDDAS